jgi:hypothetical protein
MCGVDCTVCKKREIQDCNFTGYGDSGVCTYPPSICVSCRQNASRPIIVAPTPVYTYALTEESGEYSDKSFDVLCASTNPKPVVDTLICHQLACNKADLDRTVGAILQKVSAERESPASRSFKDRAIQQITCSSSYEIFKLPVLSEDIEHHLNVGCADRYVSLRFNKDLDKFVVTGYNDKDKVGLASPLLDLLNISFQHHLTVLQQLKDDSLRARTADPYATY